MAASSSNTDNCLPHQQSLRRGFCSSKTKSIRHSPRNVFPSGAENPGSSMESTRKSCISRLLYWEPGEEPWCELRQEQPSAYSVTSSKIEHVPQYLSTGTNCKVSSNFVERRVQTIELGRNLQQCVLKEPLRKKTVRFCESDGKESFVCGNTKLNNNLIGKTNQCHGPLEEVRYRSCQTQTDIGNGQPTFTHCVVKYRQQSMGTEVLPIQRKQDKSTSRRQTLCDISPHEKETIKQTLNYRSRDGMKIKEPVLSSGISDPFTAPRDTSLRSTNSLNQQHSPLGKREGSKFRLRRVFAVENTSPEINSQSISSEESASDHESRTETPIKIGEEIERTSPDIMKMENDFSTGSENVQSNTSELQDQGKPRQNIKHCEMNLNVTDELECQNSTSILHKVRPFSPGPIMTKPRRINKKNCGEYFRIKCRNSENADRYFYPLTYQSEETLRSLRFLRYPTTKNYRSSRSKSAHKYAKTYETRASISSAQHDNNYMHYREFPKCVKSHKQIPIDSYRKCRNIRSPSTCINNKSKRSYHVRRLAEVNRPSLASSSLDDITSSRGTELHEATSDISTSTEFSLDNREPCDLCSEEEDIYRLKPRCYEYHDDRNNDREFMNRQMSAASSHSHENLDSSLSRNTEASASRGTINIKKISSLSRHSRHDNLHSDNKSGDANMFNKLSSSPEHRASHKSRNIPIREHEIIQRKSISHDTSRSTRSLDEDDQALSSDEYPEILSQRERHSSLVNLQNENEIISRTSRSRFQERERRRHSQRSVSPSHEYLKENECLEDCKRHHLHSRGMRFSKHQESNRDNSVRGKGHSRMQLTPKQEGIDYLYVRNSKFQPARNRSFKVHSRPYQYRERNNETNERNYSPNLQCYESISVNTPGKDGTFRTKKLFRLRRLRDTLSGRSNSMSSASLSIISLRKKPVTREKNKISRKKNSSAGVVKYLVTSSRRRKVDTNTLSQIEKYTDPKSFIRGQNNLSLNSENERMSLTPISGYSGGDVTYRTTAAHNTAYYQMNPENTEAYDASSVDSGGFPISGHNLSHIINNMPGTSFSKFSKEKYGCFDNEYADCNVNRGNIHSILCPRRYKQAMPFSKMNSIATKNSWSVGDKFSQGNVNSGFSVLNIPENNGSTPRTIQKSTRASHKPSTLPDVLETHDPDSCTIDSREKNRDLKFWLKLMSHPNGKVSVGDSQCPTCTDAIFDSRAHSRVKRRHQSPILRTHRLDTAMRIMTSLSKGPSLSATKINLNRGDSEDKNFKHHSDSSTSSLNLSSLVLSEAERRLVKKRRLDVPLQETSPRSSFKFHIDDGDINDVEEKNDNSRCFMSTVSHSSQPSTNSGPTYKRVGNVLMEITSRGVTLSKRPSSECVPPSPASGERFPSFPTHLVRRLGRAVRALVTRQRDSVPASRSDEESELMTGNTASAREIPRNWRRTIKSPTQIARCLGRAMRGLVPQNRVPMP